MNTQNPPVHINLWHKEFWMVALASLLVPMAVYMFLPVLPLWLPLQGDYGDRELSMVMGATGVGVFLFGTFCSYLVQHFRRNSVCIESILLMTLTIGLLHYVQWAYRWIGGSHDECVLLMLLAQRLLMGAAYGLAQMGLGSTLVIDTCESSKRTEANYSAAWFARFALALGPLAGMVVYRSFGFDGVIIASMASAVLAALLICSVHFPFRAPEEGVHLFSFDRFFLPQAMPLFLNLMVVMAVVGMLMPFGNYLLFFTSMMGGFFVALLSQRFVFRNAELKSETISALLLLAAAVIILLTHPVGGIHIVVPFLIGISVGIIGSRFLLFFIKLSRHCQRGTAQSSYFLATELGLSLGLLLHFLFRLHSETLLLLICLALVVLAFLSYHFYLHRWFIHHKNR